MSDTAPAPQADATADNPTAGGDPQASAETDWKAKFEAQQKVNRDLEAKFNGLRDSQAAQTEALAKALGLKPEEAPDVSVLAATVSTLQEQFTQTQRANLVLSVAAEHNITDPKRLETLGRITDEATLREVAAQFAQPAGGSDGASTAPGPRPDLTQGAQGTPATGTPEQDFANFLNRQMAG